MAIVSCLVLLAPKWILGAEGRQLTPADHIAALNTVRAQCITIVTALSGIVVAAYGVYRFYLEKDKQRLDEDKHLTGLFDSAAGRLAADSPAVRAVAVRTLYRLMVDSPRDHQLVVATLCDALRQYTVTPNPDATPGTLPSDVAAAAAALRDRPRRTEPHPLDLTGVQLPNADLTGADLSGAIWPRARLSGATLRDTVLERTLLGGADLSGAILTNAKASHIHLADATLTQADLTAADLRGADLRRARFRGAILTSADLSDADLTGADLTGTDLRQARGLTASMLRSATVGNDTALPPGLS
ncbi:pentapeptide repeat-containing protein [Nocardia concava]|uniref:pentapeptide repeat-containing protein n=1 Tax=Nocardia concava TaxID=257281 RepID=UPI000685A5C2|nr:pentapeptide repeat-containing protein [Nocardia concava]